MTGINVDYINPFLMAATGIIKDICQIDMKIGKPYVKETAFADGFSYYYDWYYGRDAWSGYDCSFIYKGT